MAGVPRCSVYILTEQNDSVLNTHEYRTDAEPPDDAGYALHDDCFGFYSEILHQYKDVVLSRPADLRSLARNAYHFKDKDFRPFVAIPMMQAGMIYGALVLYAKSGESLDWAPELIAFLKIIGGVFVNALERKMSELALRESEEDYRDLVDKAGLAIFIDGQDGSFHYYNERFLKLFGYTKKELASMGLFDLVHEEDKEFVRQNHEKRFQNLPAPTHYEFRGLRKDKSIVHLEVDVVELRSGGKLLATRGYLWDVTRRVESERAIQESEERYRKLVENFHDVVHIQGYDGEMLYANPALEKITGYTVADINALEVKEKVIHPDDLEKSARIVNEFIKGDALRSERFECRIITKNGNVRCSSNIVSKIIYNDRPALQFIAQDITEQKLAEKALKKSAYFERTVSEITSQFVGKEITDQSINNALQAMGKWSEASRVSLYQLLQDGSGLFCSHAWCAPGVASFVNEEKPLPDNNLTWWKNRWQKGQLIHIEDVEKLSDQFSLEKDVLRSLGVKSLILLPFCVRGKLYGALSFEDVHIVGKWSDENLRLLQISSEIISNVLERIEAEKMLKKSEEQYRMLFESNNDGIYLFGFDEDLNPTPFINVNATACKRLGYSKEELLKMTPFDIERDLNKEKIAESAEKLFKNKHLLFESTFYTKSGDKYPVELNMHLIEMDGRAVALAIERDITERKRVEEEVQKSQRLESIGLLAGGIAHDFNNLLSIMLGNAQLISLMGAQGKDVSKYIENIEKGITQATNLTQQLLTFSKGGAPIKGVIDLKPLIHDSVNLALSGMDEYAEFDIQEDLWFAEADKGQIRQVLQNLILNADQAMPNGGVINVSARNVAAADVPAPESSKHRNFVEIRITDHGIGIPKADQSKIFDPYYTTKKKGSGLGLAVAYSIIRKHDGAITLDSTIGEGTTIAFYLPAVVAQQEMQQSKLQQITHHQGKVLIMDDEELVLEMTANMLSELGYTVDTAKDGAEAIEKYTQAMNGGAPFDAVIMDLTIPAGMGGKETVAQLLKIDPRLKAIVSSGYSNDKVMSNFRDYGFSGMAAKPYTLEELSKVLSRVLEEKTG